MSDIEVFGLRRCQISRLHCVSTFPNAVTSINLVDQFPIQSDKFRGADVTELKLNINVLQSSFPTFIT